MRALFATAATLILAGCSRTPTEASERSSYRLEGRGAVAAGRYRVEWWASPEKISLTRAKRDTHLPLPTIMILRGLTKPDERLIVDFEPLAIGEQTHKPHGAIREVQPGLPFPGLDLLHSLAVPASGTELHPKASLLIKRRVWDELVIPGAQFDGHKWKFSGPATSKSGFPVAVTEERSGPAFVVDLSKLRTGAEKFEVVETETSAGPNLDQRVAQTMDWKATLVPSTALANSGDKFDKFVIRYIIDLTVEKHPFEYAVRVLQN